MSAENAAAVREGLALFTLCWLLAKVECLIRYQVSKTSGGRSYHEWPAAEIRGASGGGRAAAVTKAG